MKGVSADLPEYDQLRELAQRLHEADRSLGDRIYETERTLARLEGRPEPPPPSAPPTPRAPSRRAIGPAAARWRSLLGAIDEEYFSRELAAGVVTYEGAVTEAMSGNEIVMRFPAGATTHAHRTVLLRDLWARTKPRLHVWYTSPVGSTNTFTMRFTLRLFSVGGTTTVTALGGIDFTPAGPAVANTVLYATVVPGVVMPSVPAPCLMRFGRVTGDANANALDVLLAVVVFEEVA